MRRLAVLLPLLALTAVPQAADAAPGSCADRQVATTSGGSVSISLACRGSNGARLSIVGKPTHGSVGAIDQRANRVRFTAPEGFTGTARVRVRWTKGADHWDALVAVRVRSASQPSTPTVTPVAPTTPTTPATPVTPPTPPTPSGGASATPGLTSPAPISCASPTVAVNYMTAQTFTVTCFGSNLAPLQVVSAPTHGTLSAVSTSGSANEQKLTATYTPDAQYVGGDALTVASSDASGSTSGNVLLNVRPWRMRAIGDSVTAGFGYYGNGSLMGVSDLLDCKPTALTDRCSSNSDKGDSYTGPIEWSADFGLANNVSWAAQFANAWQGGGHITVANGGFANNAVTGSAPSDWLPGGVLDGTLKSILAEDPDLIPMTMGANPLLTDILLTEAGEDCSSSLSVAALRTCIQPFFNQVDLVPNLEALYKEILQNTEHARVVAFQYHMPIPSANLFSVWQLEQIILYFNEQLVTAVNTVKAQLPAAQADRLTLIMAQVDPGAPSPTQLPRFNIGLGPQFADTWTGPYDCGSIFTDDVDGISVQSDPTQDELLALDPASFCEGSDGGEWIIGADTGIHPSQLGYTQFANTLANVATANGWIPTLP